MIIIIEKEGGKEGSVSCHLQSYIIIMHNRFRSNGMHQLFICEKTERESSALVKNTVEEFQKKGREERKKTAYWGQKKCTKKPHKEHSAYHSKYIAI